MNLDDLSVGDIITVTQGPERSFALAGFFGGDPNDKQEDKSYQGDVLQVLAIDLPFIVVVYVGRTMFGKEMKAHIDTREFKIKRLSKEYVEALYPQMKGLMK